MQINTESKQSSATTVSYPICIGGKVSLELERGEPVYFEFTSSYINFYQERSSDTYINLLSADGDIILHLSVRRRENTIVFNSQPSGRGWSVEERIDLERVFKQTQAVIGFRLDADTWVVEIDYHEVKRFKQRIHKPLVAVSYDSDDQRQPFFAHECKLALAPEPAPPYPSSDVGSIPSPIHERLAQPLACGDNVTFTNPINDGGSIVFYSNTVNLVPPSGAQIDNTSVNLLSADDDFLLHLSVRSAENAIVFNSRPSGNPWGAEERIPLHGVFERTDATITIRLRSQSWVILVDGIPIASYNLRIKKPAISASYSGNDKDALVFSNPLLVTVGHTGEFVQTVAAESMAEPFDYVIVGSGIGGGVLATDLHEKNKRLGSSNSNFTSKAAGASFSRVPSVGGTGTVETSDGKAKRILVIERGGLLFNTHSLNVPRPSSRGTYGQMNDLFYNHFKVQFDMDEETAKIWKGRAVYCLGGRSTVWGLFSPRISDDTFRMHFPADVYHSLTNSFLQKAESAMFLSCPQTHSLHRAVIDKLNIRDPEARLPTTQWEWGRIASEFTDNKNFHFAKGAYSTVDRLLKAALDDPHGKGKFKTLVNSPVDRLEPAPVRDQMTQVEHVVVKDSDGRAHKIKCKNVILAAGAVESPAIVLRSIQAANRTLTDAFGPGFERDFGHITDHYIFYVALPFFYRNAANKDVLGGMNLQTDITFNQLDNTTVLANISLDASAFLPRRVVPDSELPQFIIAYILPSELQTNNSIELNKKNDPRIKVGYAKEPMLERKKKVLREFSVDVLNKLAAVLEIQFVKHEQAQARYIPLETVTVQDIELGEVGPGGVAHEMGSLPMPNNSGDEGVLDSNLQMKYGWSNVYVCDLSVFPYSPAANPTLTLAALSLRLSDHLIPPKDTLYQPIVVYNLLLQDVWVLMSKSRAKDPSFNPNSKTGTLVKIESGKSELWKRSTKETIQVYASENSQSYNVQIVEPGINALIVEPPPMD
ncbi:FAD/NAD(P)-binding domain-containing protein [Mycena sanguinolenta]|uniref:FAD/NAD(P)-binding domain-containing protein n=1 Tax=Mycena sanguinolenta TaxID=230812 RepID=A0A8H6XGG5_9AGAR|nr:FAD/NAD(P)-binding domain-containing protein [Mycena sanguinolenta]